MSYEGETAAEALERQQRESEADAFLANLTPSIVNRATSPQLLGSTGVRKGPTTQTVVTGPSTTSTRSIAASQSNRGVLNSLTTNLQRMEAEEKRQEALRRIKATHRSVNKDDVIACDSKPNGTAKSVNSSQSSAVKPKSPPIAKPAPPSSTVKKPSPPAARSSPPDAPKANGTTVKSDPPVNFKPAVPFAATVYGEPKKAGSRNTQTETPKPTVPPAQTNAPKPALPFAATVYGQPKKSSSPEVPKVSMQTKSSEKPDSTQHPAQTVSQPKASSPSTVIKKPSPPGSSPVNKAKAAFETPAAKEPVAKTTAPVKQSIPAKPQPPAATVKQPEPAKPQPPAATVKQPEPAKPQPPATTVKKPEPAKPQPPAAAVKQPEPAKPQPPTAAVKQPEPAKPQPPAATVKKPEPKVQNNTPSNSTVATRKIGDQTTVVTCKPGFENLKATKFLASGRGPQETGSKGTFGSSFKGDLTNRLKGSTSLVKTEEELLEGKKKKVQLGRVLDDAPPKEEPKKSEIKASEPVKSVPSPVTKASSAKPAIQIVPKPPPVAATPPAAPVTQPTSQAMPKPSTPVQAASSAPKTDPPVTTPVPPPAPPLPPIGAPVPPVTPVRSTPAVSTAATSTPAQSSTVSGSAPPVVVPPPPPPPPVGFVPPKKPMTDPSMASSGSKGAKPAVSKPQAPDMAAMFQAELMSKLKKRE